MEQQGAAGPTDPGTARPSTKAPKGPRGGIRRSVGGHRVLAGATGAAFVVGAAAGGYGIASAATGTGPTAPQSAVTSPGAPAAGSQGPARMPRVAPGGAFGVAGRAGGPFGGHGLTGLVTSVGSGSITIEVLDGSDGLLGSPVAGSSVTVTTDSSTTYARLGATATSGAVVAGETVDVQPTTATAGSASPTAASVVVVGPRVSGSVVSDDGSTIVVRDSQGFERTIHVTSSTAYTQAGAVASSSAVSSGVEIVATGTLDSNQTDLDATSVAVELPRVAGTVTGVSGSTITITERAGASGAATTVTVTTDGSTAFTSPGTASASLASVKAGDTIVATGSPTSPTSLAAKSVAVLGAGSAGGFGPGYGRGFGHGPMSGGDGGAPGAAVG